MADREGNATQKLATSGSFHLGLQGPGEGMVILEPRGQGHLTEARIL